MDASPLSRRSLLALGTAAAASTALARRPRSALAAPAAGRAATIEVDAREAPRRILRTRHSFPAQPGPFAFVYPKWLPGEHGPTGLINDVVGLLVTVGGKPIPWTRDDEDLYQFRCQVPEGARSLEITLDYVTGAGGRSAPAPAVSSSQLMVLKWNHALVYPKGVDPRTFQVTPSVRLPAGWSFASALSVERKSPELVRFQPVSLETLIDSPLAAGQHARSLDITPAGGPPHSLHLFADSPEALAIKPAQQAAYQRLCAECGGLFGGWPYRRYHFLLSLSDHIPHGGLEHHESSDNRLWERTLLDDNQWVVRAALLPHEIVHSWNGKLLRPAGLVTADYQQPMKTELLWVYEGLTTYLGDILAARSGLRTADQAREALAYSAATQDARSGRSWRSLADTAVAAPALGRSVREWSSWRRGLDYYPESALIWLEADVLIRQRSGGRKSLDDFCQLFHGKSAKGAPAVVPYQLDDVLAALRSVLPEQDWKAFFQTRVYSAAARAPLGGIEQGGWRLVYKETPSAYLKSVEQVTKEIDHGFSLGFSLRDDGTIIDVHQGSPEVRAGLGPAGRLVAVNGRKFTRDSLRSAIAATRTRPDLELLVEANDFFRGHKVAYRGGLRYPILERDPARPDLLTAILSPRGPVAAAPAAPRAANP